MWALSKFSSFLVVIQHITEALAVAALECVLNHLRIAETKEMKALLATWVHCTLVMFPYMCDTNFSLLILSSAGSGSVGVSMPTAVSAVCVEMQIFITINQIERTIVKSVFAQTFQVLCPVHVSSVCEIKYGEHDFDIPLRKQGHLIIGESTKTERKANGKCYIALATTNGLTGWLLSLSSPIRLNSFSRNSFGSSGFWRANCAPNMSNSLFTFLSLMYLVASARWSTITELIFAQRCGGNFRRDAAMPNYHADLSVRARTVTIG